MPLLNHSHKVKGRPTTSLSTLRQRSGLRPFSQGRPLTLPPAQAPRFVPCRLAPSISHVAPAEHRDGVEGLGLGLGAPRDVHERLHHLCLRLEGGCCPVFEGIQGQLAKNLEILALSAHSASDAAESVHFLQLRHHNVIKNLLGLSQRLLVVLRGPLDPPFPREHVGGDIVVELDDAPGQLLPCGVRSLDSDRRHDEWGARWPGWSERR
mmetsp:Transcript_103713/g.231691  ORF Transcript_103713/g.231691 Transcript_103713/m.231691 type:complete len:209 (-) Transcript_103713:23-649(-)